MCVYVLSSSGVLPDEKHRQNPGGIWVWFLSETTDFQGKGSVDFPPAAGYDVAEAGRVIPPKAPGLVLS